MSIRNREIRHAPSTADTKLFKLSVFKSSNTTLNCHLVYDENGRSDTASSLTGGRFAAAMSTHEGSSNNWERPTTCRHRTPTTTSRFGEIK